ncbi:MAG: DsrE family protein [Paracoccaceae bacterium]
MTSIFRTAALALALVATPFIALAEVNRVAIHVDENDPQRMNLALNNANNIVQYYESQGEEAEVQIVTYGPGLHMLRADTSPVADRVMQAAATGHISFAACGNTLRGMQSRETTEISLLPEATVVPSGAVHLIELQQEGWAYLRP